MVLPDRVLNLIVAVSDLVLFKFVAVVLVLIEVLELINVLVFTDVFCFFDVLSDKIRVERLLSVFAEGDAGIGDTVFSARVVECDRVGTGMLFDIEVQAELLDFETLEVEAEAVESFFSLRTVELE